MQKQKSNLRQRKDLKRTKDEDTGQWRGMGEWETVRYWTAFKFLSLMDADDTLSQNKKRFFMTAESTTTRDDRLVLTDFKRTECRSKFDELICLHCTTCEHMTNFFGYFHRNYMLYLEIALYRGEKMLKGELPPPGNITGDTYLSSIWDSMKS